METVTTSGEIQTLPAAGAPTQAAGAAGARAAAQPAARPGRILLAEDDASARRYLEVALRRAGYVVLAASDGLEAMKLALTQEVDAVVTDCQMPHIGGLELCRFLRGHPRLSALPVLLLSGSELPDETGESADCCLRKPVDPEELARRISALLPRAD